MAYAPQATFAALDSLDASLKLLSQQPTGTRVIAIGGDGTLNRWLPMLLQNQLVPDLNQLEGLIDQGDDLAIVTSQPRFDIVAVTQEEIDAWFVAQGFEKVTASGYYRAEDNLGVFDAHSKNLVRFEDTFIPFDVIPCRPAGGFLQFIADTLAKGGDITKS